MDFFWLEKNTIAGGAIPVTSFDFDDLSQAGIKTIISLTEKPLNTTLLANYTFITQHLPLSVYEIPSKEQVNRFLQIMYQSLIESSCSVFVHCSEGYGRSCMFLAIYLVAFKNISAEKAINRVRTIRTSSILSHQEYFLKIFISQFTCPYCLDHILHLIFAKSLYHGHYRPRGNLFGILFFSITCHAHEEKIIL